MMTTRRDAVLVVVEPIHERLDGNGKDIRGADELPAGPHANSVQQALFFGVHNGSQFLRIQQRAVGGAVHRLAKVNVSRNVGRNPEPLYE
jgi:hypothetical protein